MMMSKLIPVALCCTALVAAGCNDRDPVRAERETATAAPSASRVSGQGRQPMILNLRGTGMAEMRTLVIDGRPTTVPCFTVDLIDMHNGRVVGKGTDCLQATPDDRYPDGLEVVGTTIFDFGNGHTFTSRGLTSVQPTTHGSPEITHITGAIPPEGENSIVEATGRYQRMQARVRLSGAVNMSRMEQGQVYFDCIFVVHPL